MTSRQRVCNAIDRMPVDRIPRDMWAEPEVIADLCGALGVGSEEEVRRALDLDMRWFVPDYTGPGRYRQ